jgi:MED6 mediator sub complex component
VLTEAFEPVVFTIKKQYRDKEDKLTVVAYYYVHESNIYQAPTLHSLLHNRLRRCLWNVRGGLEKMQVRLPFAPTFEHQRQRDGEVLVPLMLLWVVFPRPLPLSASLSEKLVCTGGHSCSLCHHASQRMLMY